jgi:hypothetical protein
MTNLSRKHENTKTRKKDINHKDTKNTKNDKKITI